MHNFLETDFPTIFDTQQVFRVIMDSMAHPGKVNCLPNFTASAPQGLSPFIAAVCFTLLDSEACFYVENQAWRDYLRVNTGSQLKPVDSA